MMNKADALFIKITGGAIVLLLGIVGFFSRQTYEEIKENRKAQQQTEKDVLINKSEVENYCEVFDLRLMDFDRRISMVEKQLNINRNVTD